MNFKITNDPLQDVIDAQFEFFNSDVMKKEGRDLYQAAQTGDKKQFLSALVEFYTSAAAFSVSAAISRLMTPEQQEQIDFEVSRRKTEMVDETIAKIFKES
jgi:hypothetical protein